MRTICGKSTLHFLQEFRSIHARHPHVGYHDVVRGACQRLQGFHTAADELHVPFMPHGTEHTLQAVQDIVLVVDKEEPFHAGS
jgi:hypothetical protein